MQQTSNKNVEDENILNWFRYNNNKDKVVKIEKIIYVYNYKQVNFHIV